MSIIKGGGCCDGNFSFTAPLPFLLHISFLVFNLFLLITLIMNHSSHSIIQRNCRGLWTYYEDLLTTIKTHRPLLMCLQETSMANFSLTLTNYAIYNPPHNSLLIHKSIPYTLLNITALFRVLVSKVSAQHCHHRIIYISPKYHFTQSDLTKVLKQ